MSTKYSTLVVLVYSNNHTASKTVEINFPWRPLTSEHINYEFSCFKIVVISYDEDGTVYITAKEVENG